MRISETFFYKFVLAICLFTAGMLYADQYGRDHWNYDLSHVHGPGFQYKNPEFKHWPRSETYHHVRTAS